MITSEAVRNREKLADIRQRMLRGELSYEQAKTEAAPIIADINSAAKRIAKRNNVRPQYVNFAALMR